MRLLVLIVALGAGGCTSEAGAPGAGGAGGGGGFGSVGPGGSRPACNASAADGIVVSPTDAYGSPPYRLGYPPYAIDGCRLLYVAASPSGGSDVLLLRDLQTGAETVVAGAAEQPRRPSIAGDVLAWEATEGKPVVRVKVGSGAAMTLSGAFDHAGEPRATTDAVVFTAWKSAQDLDDSDVMLYRVATGALDLVAGGLGQQRFADVSATHVAYTDFSEDPDGIFDEDGEDASNVVILDRASGSAQPWPKPGKQGFPMLSGGKVGFLDWGLVHPEPKFGAYDIYVGDVGAPASAKLVAEVETQAPYVRPVLHAGVFEWIEWPNGNVARLWRRPADLSAPAAPVAGVEQEALFGPAATDAITVVATDAVGNNLVPVKKLIAIER